LANSSWDTLYIVTDGPLVKQITMFINITDTIIKGVTNTEHYSQNFKNYSQQISLSSYIQFFGLMVLGSQRGS